MDLWTHIIEIPSGNVDVGSDGLEVVVRFLVTNIACTQYLLDFSRDKQFLEFGGEIVSSMRNVEVPDNEN